MSQGVPLTVRDAGMTQPPRTIVYFPMVTETPARDGGTASINAPRGLSYAIRSDRTGTPGLLRDVREVINSINANLPLGTVGTMEQTVSRSLARTSFTLIMLAIGAAVALLLGSVGVYGVIGYVVSQRTKELGVRIALGARPLDVKHLVLRQGLLIACFGVTVGLVASFWATRLMAGLLFGVSPLDPVT